jgi:hypothetical protein
MLYAQRHHRTPTPSALAVVPSSRSDHEKEEAADRKEAKKAAREEQEEANEVARQQRRAAKLAARQALCSLLGFSAEEWERLPPDEQAGWQKKARILPSRNWDRTLSLTELEANRENAASLLAQLNTREAEREAALPNAKRPKTQQQQL